MTVHSPNPIVIKKQIIHWRVVSGHVIGIQKYTKTHVTQSGSRDNYSVDSWIEIIIELFIRQDNGNETQIILRKEETSSNPFLEEGMGEIQVRERQYVSGVLGYSNGKTSDWIVFVNHDDCKWYWVVEPLIFLESIDIFPVPLWWNILFSGVILFAILLFVFLPFNSIFIDSAFQMSLRSFEFVILIFSILICLFMIRIYLIFSCLNTTRPKIAKMARQLIS